MMILVTFLQCNGPGGELEEDTHMNSLLNHQLKCYDFHTLEVLSCNKGYNKLLGFYTTLKMNS